VTLAHRICSHIQARQNGKFGFAQFFIKNKAHRAVKGKGMDGYENDYWY
jgi:hypothetical protein